MQLPCHLWFISTLIASKHHLTVQQDHGFDAWAYMISTWLAELFIWFYPFSYSVFLSYYTSHEFEYLSSMLLALVGSLSTELIYLSLIMVFLIITWYPAWKKQMMYVGLGLSVAGLIGAAFSFWYISYLDAKQQNWTICAGKWTYFFRHWYVHVSNLPHTS